MSNDIQAWGSGPTRYFYELQPDTILAAIESQGYLPTGRLMPLNSMENRVFEVEVLPPESEVDSESDRFRIMKFYRPGRWSKDQILDEHQFTQELADQDIPVITAEASSQSESCHFLEELGIYYAIYKKQGGRNPDELDRNQLEWIGRLLARMHNVGANHPAPHRIEIGPERYGLQALDYLFEHECIPEDLELRYEDLVEEICQRSEPLFQACQKIRLHGDAHQGNLLWSATGPFWVDFDDMVMGPAVQDLWLLAAVRGQDGYSQLASMLRGYRWLRKFPQEELSLIEPLRALRYIHFSAWIAKRWSDPAFPRTFTEFGSRDYWMTQIEDLQECLQLIIEPDPGLFSSTSL
ncbi:MAG: serine/threonine protein kinase [Verrucomicrobiota bacterium]